MKKKILLFIIIIMLIVLPVNVCYAGSIPEDLLSNNNAQLYFGEILDYSENTKSAAVSPVKNIKGDIVIGSKQTLENCVFVGTKDNIPKRGEVCLIAYYDDVNPIYIFRTTSENIPTLKIKNIEGIDMWERLQQYINEGKYTQAEIQRVNKQGLSVQAHKGINEQQFLLSALYTKEVFIISLILILLYMILGLVKRKWSAIVRIIAGCTLALYGLVAAGGAKHYFLYRLYQKWGDVFEDHIREFIPWAIAEHSKDIFILGSIAIALIIIGATLMKKLSRKHINIYVALSFVSINIVGIVLSFFSINKMFDIGAHITSFAYFVSLWLFGILIAKYSEQIGFGDDVEFAVIDRTLREELNNRITNTEQNSSTQNKGKDLSVLTLSNPRLSSNLGESPEQAYHEIGEKLDMSIRVVIPEASIYREKLNLIIAANDLTDIMELQWSDINRFKKFGIFLPLNDAIEKYAPDIAKFLKENQDAAKMVTNDKGEYIAIPIVSSTDEEVVTSGPIIRKDLFDQFNIDVPKTTDEWYAALKIFKENGIKSPFTMNSNLSDLFSFFDAVDTFYIKDNKIHYGPAEPRYKEALATASKWYAEGLIDADFVVMKAEQTDKKLIDGDAAVTFGYVNDNLKRLLASPESGTFSIAGVSYPTYSSKEKKVYNRLEGKAAAGGVVITSRCKDIESAMKFINSAYKDYKINYIYPEQQEAVKIWSKGQHDAECVKLPEILDFTEEESTELQNLLADITTYNHEMSIKYILGVESFDQYDKYQETLNKLGLSKALQIYQEAYNRYLER